MFGGVCFLVNGNMCCGIDGNGLMVRLGEKGVQRGLKEPHTSVFDLTGKVMRTMLMVEFNGNTTEAALKSWTDRAVRYARSLPPK